MKTPWPGFNDMDSLIIPLAWSGVPLPETPVYIDSDRFESKHELHVTVIGKKAGREVQTRRCRTWSTLRRRGRHSLAKAYGRTRLRGRCTVPVWG